MIGLRYDLMNSSAEISSQAKYSPRVGGGGGVNYSVGKLLVLIFSKNLIFMVWKTNHMSDQNVISIKDFHFTSFKK